MRVNPICPDENVDRLETMLKNATTKPHSRQRWARQVIERLRVSELAAAILLNFYISGAPEKVKEHVWEDAQNEAIETLRRAGIIR